MAPSYPSTRRDTSVVDDLHGRSIPDPYRWLEDPDTSETTEWVDQQNVVTNSYLSSVQHLRPHFRSTVERLLNYDKYSAVWRRGPFYYYYHHVGLANQAVLMQASSLDADPVVFLDPNNMSDDGTVSFGTKKWSFDGNFLAYGIKRGGSDWEEIRIINCHTHEHLNETLDWAKFTSIAWTHDNKGFYYCRYPTPRSLEGVDDKEKRGAETDQSLDQTIYYHVVNTPQKEDRVVYADPSNPKRMYSLSVTLDGSYLLVYASEDCSPKNQVWYVLLEKHFGEESSHLVKWIDDSYDSDFTCIANDGARFYFQTNWNAPRFRIIAAELNNSPRDSHSVIVDETDDVLSSAVVVNSEELALVYMRDAHDVLSIHRLRLGTKLYDIPLPDLGSVSLAGSREDDFLTFQFSSFLYAGTVFYVDLTLPVDDGMRVFRKMDPPGFDPSKYQTRQVFYPSKDGTKIPMFIIGPRNESATESMTKRPCLLYGYGGFMISLTPYFSVRWASWLDCVDGTVAIANLRGGAEYGSEWHDAGILGKKQNVFDDFQWAARYLVDDLAITDPKSLMIMGGSNGGLLVGACVNQAPELYAAAVAQVGVLDMLRFHKFTIGSTWVSDFGNPDNAEEFEHLIKYSPLHNVFSPDERGVPYPAVLLTTGDHDDRVVPLHTLKYGAELQYKAGGSKLQNGRPLLIRIDVKAGHGGGKPTSKVIDEICDTWMFAARAMDLKLPSVSDERET